MVLTDTAFTGPQIAFNDGYLIAWTGADAQHTLNLATFEGF
jgi:allophanate hydrolase subunit 2